MKIKYSIISFVFFTLTSIPIFGQDKSDTMSTAKIPDLEKVYLHTDKDYYAMGESLWYKAYSVYAYTSMFYDYSKNLYVELVSNDAKIVARNITRLEKGIGKGDFILADSLGVKPGSYQLRAYTNWMRNFDKPFVFTKNIEIIDLSKYQSTKNDKNLNTKNKLKVKEVSTKKLKLDIQFFPEGGSLIENISSIVAFKIVDKNGNPYNIDGEIFDSEDNFISMFKSEYAGMGKFSFTPEIGKKYYAKFSGNDKLQEKIKFPEIQQEGYSTNVLHTRGKHYINIKTNETTLAKQAEKMVTLVMSTRGVTYFQGTIPIEKLNTTFVLPTNKLPEGICKITIYDDLNRPQSERLVFIEKKHDVEVSIQTNKSEYRTKEKVDILVASKTKSGIPVDGSFSLVSRDANINSTAVNGTNICSYYLLESEIKGRIYQPSYYFNKANKGRLYHLDLLLLTQGWRDFLWKKIPNKKEKSNFELEKGIDISGRALSSIMGIAKPNRNISMLLSQNNKLLPLQDTTDVNGRFMFKNIYFKGMAKLMLNAKNKRGKDRGLVMLDSLYNKPIEVNFSPRKFSLQESNRIQEMEDIMYTNNLFFNIPIDNTLDEVIVTGNSKKDNQQSMFGTADYTYTVPDEGPNFSTIYQLISFNIPGVNINNNTVSFNRNSGSAVIFIDGMEMNQDELEFIAPEDVEKIETIKTGAAGMLGSRGDNGAILIYTKGGGLNVKTISLHSKVAKVKGYQDTRIFYSPNYDKPETIDKTKADVRNTLYWNPFVHPDKNGIAKVSYFNSDVKTTVNITLEGMTISGIPIVINTSYNVK